MSRRALLEQLRTRFGDNLDISRRPEILDAIRDWGDDGPRLEPGGGAFGITWMDSWVAHWGFARESARMPRGEAMAKLMEALAEARIRERLEEIRDILERSGGGRAEPPDGGPPEPGVPPVGPAAFVPPDGGPPEPGTPPAGPAAFTPPDAGPPEPGTPPAGPTGGFGEIEENPWILYWFLSIKTPLLLEVVDLHIDRRLQEIADSASKG